jgi:hypothetical protein
MIKKSISLLCVVISCLSLYAEKPFIVGSLVGQLGNQFFQIATTVSLALDHDATPIFPDLRHSDLYNIPINYKHVFSHLHTSDPYAAVSLVYSEPHFHFSKIPFHPNMVLKGYFQSEKYFKHHKEEIIKLFQPSEDVKHYLQNKYSHILDHPKTVAVHIRMYKDTSPHFHPFVGWDYIEKAIESFDHDSLFVIFSDQMSYCKRELKKLAKTRNLVFIEDPFSSLRHDFYDFYLISMCKHQIISNSSFSWWAAYLNQNPEKIVIAPSPSRWFGPGLSYNNTKDLLPPEWKVLF